MPVIHKPAMRKLSFSGAVEFEFDKGAVYVCQSRVKKQLTICYNAVLLEESSLQGCYVMLTCNWLPIY
jgi:hypothetical protein